MTNVPKTLSYIKKKKKQTDRMYDSSINLDEIIVLG